jgi:hypothetical protein
MTFFQREGYIHIILVVTNNTFSFPRTSESKRLAFADDEVIKYINERKKKQSVPSTPSTLFGNMSRGRQLLGSTPEDKKQPQQKVQAARNRLTQRALYDTEEEEEETEMSRDR